MKSVTVDELPKLWATVLAWLRAGESVELRDHEKRVATMQPEEVSPVQKQEEQEQEEAWRRRRAWLERLEATRREIFGDSMLTLEESAFIRDRGDY